MPIADIWQNVGFHWLETGDGISGSAPIAQQAGAACRSARLPRQRLVPVRFVLRLLEQVLRRFSICCSTLHQQEFALDPLQFGRDPATVGPCDPGFDQCKPFGDPPGVA